MTGYGEKSGTLRRALPIAFGRGFTLIELLVVISIISMLMSILAPSLKKAREQGRTVACQTNIRQLTFSWNMYSMDNRDRLCSATIQLNGPRPWLNETDPPYPPNHWAAEGDGVIYNTIIGTEEALLRGVLWDYLEVPGVYQCHSHVTDYKLSYSISNTMASHLPLSGQSIFTGSGDFSTPADRLVFIDSIGIRPKDESNFPEVYELELHGFCPIRMDTRQWYPDGKLINRHNGGTNLSFADGHMGYYRWKDYRTTWYNDGRAAIPQQGSETNNPDFDYLFKICRGTGVQLNNP